MANSDTWESVLAALTNSTQRTSEAQFSAALEQLRAADQAQAEAIERNTTAVIESTGTAGGQKSSDGILSKLFGNWLTTGPLIGGLVKLFGGGGAEETPPPLMTYTPPAPLAFQGTVERQAGLTQWEQPEATGRGRAEPVVMPQITVQVSAMDSRSFLDHSDEIARAVKQAMLNSHALNDVVSEL